jgi:hypothetical protein
MESANNVKPQSNFEKPKDFDKGLNAIKKLLRVPKND